MTAVEWLEMQLGSKIADANIRISAPKFFELINQAKEMEKQQIVDAVDYGKNHSYEYSYENEVDYYSSENYYNEKFKR